MTKLDEQGNLTLAPHEVLTLRGMIYQYGILDAGRESSSSERQIMMRQMRCMLPVPEEED